MNRSSNLSIQNVYFQSGIFKEDNVTLDVTSKRLGFYAIGSGTKLGA